MGETFYQDFKSRAKRFLLYAWFIASLVYPAADMYTGFKWTTNSTADMWWSDMTITLPVLMFLVFVIALAIQVLNLLFERHRKGKSKMKYLINDVKAKKLTEEIDVLDRLKEKNKRELEKIKLEAKQIVDKEGEDVDNQETTTS